MIYCVEDDDDIRELMLYTLRTTGYEAQGFADGESFWEVVSHKPADLILLDIMLPGEDGIHLLARLQSDSRTMEIPVIMATAKGTEFDKVKGLDMGADDYLVKPFAFSELVARIEVLLRRAAGTAPAPDALVLALADLQVDLGRRRATRAGQRIDLSAKEFQLLSLLLRRKGEVLSRTEIAEQVWDVNFDHGTNVIDVAVRRLRSKLDQPFEHPLLHTVRGMGYVLEER